jgi:xanthine dehydrogenase YagS FAD-binding subunit
MKNFQYFTAGTVDEAVGLIDKYKGTVSIIAGGTDLLGELKDRSLPTQPDVLVNIKGVTGLNTITEDATGLKVGALATLYDISNSSTVSSKYAALAQAAGAVGSPQLRVIGTIGGNLCQHVRCWYFRADKNYFNCIRKGGTVCYAVAGDNRFHAILGGKTCYAVSPSDTATALGALNANLMVQGTAGTRTIALDDLYNTLGITLAPDEILTQVQVPTPNAGSKSAFVKFGIRKAFDFAIVSAAAVITSSGGSVTDARIYLGGVGPVPYRATKSEAALKGNAITEALADSAAAATMADAVPLTKNAYIVDIARTIMKDAILAAGAG